MGNVVIGIDVGTTALKAAAFDASSGRTLGSVADRIPLHTGDGDVREQSATALERAARSAFNRLRAKVGADWRSVVGLGLAAQGGSSIIADRATGSALTPMMLWNDMRAHGFTTRITEGRPAAFWRRRTMRDAPGIGLPRILWFRENAPELLAATNIYVGAGEYMMFHLTGAWRQDACNALQIGCYNARKDCLDKNLLGLVDMPVSFVAPLRRGHETSPLSAEGALLTGLPEGLPVAGPYIDHEAGYMSAAQVSKHPLQCSLGTAWVGNFVMDPDTEWRSPWQLVLPAVVGTGYLVVQPLLTGNTCWDWALETLIDRDQGAALKKAAGLFADRLLPANCLSALPWLNMPNPLWPASIGGGALFGVGLQTDNADIVRALAFSMVAEMARVFGEARERGKIDSVVLGGGASKGRHFKVLFAELFAPLPVYSVEEEDTSGARGAVYAFAPQAACAKTLRIERADEEMRTTIRQAYDRYLELFARLYADGAAGGMIVFPKERKS